ncbi:hypothetical protein ACFFRR_004493 [Megaselia abdita]
MSENGEGNQVQKFLNDLNLGNIAHLFSSYSMEELLELEERDLAEIIHETKYIKERIRLRKQLFSKTPTPVVGVFTFNLKDIVDRDGKTKYLPQTINQKSQLDKKDINALANAVVKKWREINYVAGPEDYKYAWRQIKHLFPLENEAIYIGDGRKRGKLQEKMYYCTKQEKKRQKEQAIKESKDQEPNESAAVNDNDDNVEDEDLEEHDPEDLEVALDFLENNVGPIEKAEVLWRKFFNELCSVKVTVDRFKMLTGCDGYKIIRLHYNLMHNNKSNRLILKFEDFKEKMIPLFKKNVCDATSKKFVAALSDKGESMSRNQENFLIFQSMHAYLVATVIIDPYTKKKFRYTIGGSRDKFITVVKSYPEVQVTINKLKHTNKNAKKTLQPMVFAIMPTPTQFEKFIVYIPEIFYEFTELLEAITCCFMAFHVLQFHYNPECIILWRFLEKFFFEMPQGTSEEDQWDHNCINMLIPLL